MAAEPDFDWAEDSRPPGVVHADLSPRARLLLGILTFWPIAYIAVFMIAILGMVFAASQSISPERFFAVIMVLHVGTILLSMGLMVYYVVYIVRDSRFSSDRRLVWILVVVLAGMLGQAVFYVLWFWRREPAVIGLSVPDRPAPPVPSAPSD